MFKGHGRPDECYIRIDLSYLRCTGSPQKSNCDKDKADDKKFDKDRVLIEADPLNAAISFLDTVILSTTINILSLFPFFQGNTEKKGKLTERIMVKGLIGVILGLNKDERDLRNACGNTAKVLFKQVNAKHEDNRFQKRVSQDSGEFTSCNHQQRFKLQLIFRTCSRF